MLPAFMHRTSEGDPAHSRGRSLQPPAPAVLAAARCGRGGLSRRTGSKFFEIQMLNLAGNCGLSSCSLQHSVTLAAENRRTPYFVLAHPGVEVPPWLPQARDIWSSRRGARGRWAGELRLPIAALQALLDDSGAEAEDCSVVQMLSSLRVI